MNFFKSVSSKVASSIATMRSDFAAEVEKSERSRADREAEAALAATDPSRLPPPWAGIFPRGSKGEASLRGAVLGISANFRTTILPHIPGHASNPSTSAEAILDGGGANDAHGTTVSSTAINPTPTDDAANTGDDEHSMHGAAGVSRAARCAAALASDDMLDKVRFTIVPKRVDEATFWQIYFARVEDARRAFLSLDDEARLALEEPLVEDAGHQSDDADAGGDNPDDAVNAADVDNNEKFNGNNTKGANGAGQRQPAVAGGDAAQGPASVDAANDSGASHTADVLDSDDWIDGLKRGLGLSVDNDDDNDADGDNDDTGNNGDNDDDAEISALQADILRELEADDDVGDDDDAFLET
jgi:hypothetical protein